MVQNNNIMLKLPYCVKLNHDLYTIGARLSTYRKWLRENIGEPYETWRTDILDDKLCVYFKNEEDALFFKLCCE
jgi:hypothetical protein